MFEASKLVAEALGEFEASAARYCHAVRASAPSQPDAPTLPLAGEFASALRALAISVGHECTEVLKALLSWHDSERRAAAQGPSEDARAAAESAVNCTFCAALIAALGGPAAACCEPILLDAVQTRCQEFYQLVLPAPGRQELARRRLEALGGRSEEGLWSRLVGVLCRRGAPHLARSPTVLPWRELRRLHARCAAAQVPFRDGLQHAAHAGVPRALASTPWPRPGPRPPLPARALAPPLPHRRQVEAKADGGEANPHRGSRAAAPGRGALAMCRALRGLRLPAAGTAAGAAATRAFWERVERLLGAKALRCARARTRV